MFMLCQITDLLLLQLFHHYSPAHVFSYNLNSPSFARQFDTNLTERLHKYSHLARLAHTKQNATPTPPGVSHDGRFVCQLEHQDCLILQLNIPETRCKSKNSMHHKQCALRWSSVRFKLATSRYRTHQSIQAPTHQGTVVETWTHKARRKKQLRNGLSRR